MTEKPKQTLWLQRAGHFDTNKHGNFDHEVAMKMLPRWIVKKAQNITQPSIGVHVNEDQILELIKDNITVNMS